MLLNVLGVGRCGVRVLFVTIRPTNHRPHDWAFSNPVVDEQSYLSSLFSISPQVRMMAKTPHERRMAALARMIPPPPWDPEGRLLAQHIMRIGNLDINSHFKARKAERLMPHWMYARLRGGSGFIMADTVRTFFMEYAHRICMFGFYSFPTSFNVVEAFLKFDRDMCVFDFLPEREHLLSINDYFDWYNSTTVPRDTNLLSQALQENIIYSYTFVNASSGYQVTCGDSSLIVAGIAFVRHEGELSCILLAGQKPPFPPDDEISDEDISPTHSPGKENLTADESLDVEDRYLKEYPDFARVLMLTRFDLRSRSFDVRYVNQDRGRGYLVSTDDTYVFEPEDDPTGERKKSMAAALQTFNPLFSELVSLIYLPLFFAAEVARVVDTEFPTALYVDKKKNAVKKAKRELGAGQLSFFRTVRCLTSDQSPSATAVQTITPPDMEFQATGYWKTLPAGQIGNSKEGLPIVGRTWVERKESWFTQQPEAFILRKNTSAPSGPDPGVIYIVRSPSHASGIYKVGLTRRTADERAGELSSATGVPLPFGVLAHWEVGDCAGVEAEVHKRLEWARINARREFFAAPLSDIVKTIELVISATDSEE